MREGKRGDRAGQPDAQSSIQRVLQTRAETRAFYNKMSRVYDLLAERSEAPLRAKGLEMLAVRPGETVLEIGFGTGHCLADLSVSAGREGRVVGVDLSEGMARRTQRHLARSGLAGSTLVTCGDALELPLPTGGFDAVVSSFTLELFDTPDIPRALSEWRRVLRPGGRLVVVSLSKQPNELAVRAYEWTHRHLPNLLDCRPIFVERALRAAGLEVEQARLEHMWVPVEIVLAIHADDLRSQPSNEESTSRGNPDR